MISTEKLLTRSEGFGIVTATPAQRAACRIIDGAPLGELAEHPDVVALVGGAEAIESISLHSGTAPTEVVFLAAIRSAKTIVACCAGLRATQCVDMSRLGPGEIPRVSLVSLKLDTSAVAFRLVLETMRASRVLSRLIIGEPTANSIMVRHPSGRPIELSCVAMDKAGSGLVARWSAGVIFDEAPRMAASGDSVASLGDARTAVLGRLLPGAQILFIGSPWAPHGDVYKLTEQHWGRPSSSMVVLRGTGPMLNPTWWTPERCARLERQDPVAYRTDVMGDFADPESGLLNPISVNANTRQTPLELPVAAGATYAAAVDPSEGGAGGNGFSLVIVQRDEDEQGRIKVRVVLAREWRGMRPEQCWEEIARACATYGIHRTWSDQYAASANVDLAARFGLHVEIDKTTQPSKLEDFTNLATLIHSDQLELSPDPTLRRDLLSVKRRITQAGMTIVLPRTGDGRHADLASALCSAVKRVATGATFVVGYYGGESNWRNVGESSTEHPPSHPFDPWPDEVEIDRRGRGVFL